MNTTHDPTLPSLTNFDDLPPGPYMVGMTWGPRGLPEEPYTVVCATGQAVTGHCASRMIAEKIAAALNQSYPRDP